MRCYSRFEMWLTANVALGGHRGAPSSSRSHTLPSRSSIPVGVASFAASSVLAAALRDILATAAIDEALL